MYHVSIWIGCLELIGQNENYGGDKYLFYACQNWCYHLHLALSHDATLAVDAHHDVVMLMQKMGQEWIRIWMYGLENITGVVGMIEICESVMARGEVSLFAKKFVVFTNIYLGKGIPAEWTDVIGSIEKILDVIKVNK